MKLRSTNDIQDHLDGEIGWRLREIDQLKKLVREGTSLAQNALIRAGVPLVYAHWEGFVKSSAEAFLNFVVHQRKRYRELNECFSLHGLAGRLEILDQSKKHHRRLEALRFIALGMEQEAHFAWQDKINTKANLNSEVFESIAAAIGLDTARYVARYALMDEQLLKSRNQIAHGERLTVSGPAFCNLADETITLIRWFKTDLENAVALKGYLAKASNKPLQRTKPPQGLPV
jgi:hypothetical protein